MRASVGLFLLSVPVAGVLSTARQAPTDVRMAGMDDVAPEPVPPEIEPLAPCELAAPPRWTRVADEVVATLTAVEGSENWLAEAATRRPPRDVALDKLSVRHDAILEKLEATRVRGIEFQKEDLDQVVGRLRALTGLDFRVAPNLRTSKGDEVRITIPPLDEVSVRWLLDNVVTAPYELRWEISDGVVTIAADEDVRRRMRLKYFDVRSIVSRIVTVRGADGRFEPREVPEPLLSPDALVERIRSEVDPETWSDEIASVVVKNGSLIVKNRSDTIEHVGQLVEGLRETRVRWADGNTPPGPPPAHPTLWNRSWSVVDLVGTGSEDGTIEPGDGSATDSPYAPGALIALLRLNVESDLVAIPEASIELDQGTLRVHLNWSAIVRLERLLRELRARAQPAPDPSDYEVGFGGPSNIALAR